ncbi:MAG: ABC transporter permease [Sedimentisphaerales bacterium]|nr:ABC transporter permease [Sedimentisphaerales bacterium]
MYDVLLPIKFFFRRRITILAVLAVALSVFIVVVVMTVMHGLVLDFREKNHIFFSDCIVSTDSLVGFSLYEEFITQLEKTDFLESASPVIHTFGLVEAETSGRNAALDLMGIDIDRHVKTTGFADSLYYRSDEPTLAFEPEYDANRPGCVVGIDLLVDRQRTGQYSQLSYLPMWSYLITCFPLTPKGTLAKVGTALTANSRTFYYSDNCNSGLAKLDGSVVYLPFNDLQSLCGMDTPSPRANAVYIKFKQGCDIEACTQKVSVLWKDFIGRKKDFPLANLFDTVSVQDWKAYRRGTIAPMEKEQTMLILLFALVGLITVFIIFVIFYMIISRKSRDIGILKSLGVSKLGIVRVFLHLAFLIGFLGSVIGILSALLFLVNINSLEGWLFDKFGFQMWNREIYAIGEIPYQAKPYLLAAVGICAVAACLLGALLPTLNAVRKKCVDVLRVNQL